MLLMSPDALFEGDIAADADVFRIAWYELGLTGVEFGPHLRKVGPEIL